MAEPEAGQCESGRVADPYVLYFTDSSDLLSRILSERGGGVCFC